MRNIEINKLISSQNIVYRNLERTIFLTKVLNSFDKKHVSFKKIDANNQLVFINIIEGKHNPNGKPIEQYAIRDESGKMIMNNMLIFEIFIPDLIKMIQRNNELFLPEELIMDTFEIENYHTREKVNEDENTEPEPTCELTNSYISSS